jgi:hypothetical protein
MTSVNVIASPVPARWAPTVCRRRYGMRCQPRRVRATLTVGVDRAGSTRRPGRR